MSELRALLRIAARDARRARGRSALVVLMMALPVFAMTFMDVLAQTAQPDSDEVIARELGGAQYVLRADAPIGSGLQQAPDPLDGVAITGSTTVSDSADPAKLLPAGGRVLHAATTSLEVRTRAGTAIVEWNEVAAADPAFAGRFELKSGRAPRDRSETLVTPELLERLGGTLGGRLSVPEPETELTVVGTARQAGMRGVEAVYALPGAVIEPGPPTATDDVRRAVYVVDAPPLSWPQVMALNAQGVSAYDRDIVTHPPARAEVPFYAQLQEEPGGSGVLATILVGALIVGLSTLEVVLLAGAAFAVGARRQARALALLAATGGTPRHVRLVVLAGGLVLGMVAAVVGVAGGVAAAAVARPLLERFADTSFARFDVRPLELLAIAAVAFVTGVLAAIVPARAAARQDVVAGLAGRRGQVSGPRRVPVIGVALTGLGVVAATIGSLWTAAQQATGVSSGESYVVAAAIAGGAALAVIGLVVLSPTLVALMGRPAARLPLAPRLALRDAARHRSRSGPAMAAVLAAVGGSAALLLVVAANDDRDRRGYRPMLPEQTAAIPLIDSVSNRTGIEEVERAAGPVLRALSAQLPVRESVVIPQVRACWDGDCRTVEAATHGDEVLDTAGFAAFGGGGYVVGDGGLLEDVYGIDDARARAVLASGGVVALDRALVAGGRVTLDVFAPQGALPERRRIERVRFAAAFAPAPESLAGGVVLSPAAAKRLGMKVRPGAIFLRLDREPTRDEEDAAREAVFATGMRTAPTVERGYVSSYGLGLLALVLGAAVITLGAAGISTGLAQADARGDHATLAAVGADPRMRRTLAGFQALSIAGLGTALGVAVGFVPAVALIGAIDSLRLVIPWLPLLGLLVVVPLLAAASAWACTRSRLVLERRSS
jgi:putative ABC transport system permease protein